MTKAKKNTTPADSADTSLVAWSLDVNTDGLKALTLPPIVKIKEMPVGAAIDCTVYDMVPSQTKDIKNPLLLVTLADGATKVSIPLVGGLAGTFLADKENCVLREASAEDLRSGIMGKRCVIRKTGFKRSKQWKDDNGNQREYPIFEVCIDE